MRCSARLCASVVILLAIITCASCATVSTSLTKTRSISVSTSAAVTPSMSAAASLSATASFSVSNPPTVSESITVSGTSQPSVTATPSATAGVGSPALSQTDVDIMAPIVSIGGAIIIIGGCVWYLKQRKAAKDRAEKRSKPTPSPDAPAAQADVDYQHDSAPASVTDDSDPIPPPLVSDPSTIHSQGTAPTPIRASNQTAVWFTPVVSDGLGFTQRSVEAVSTPSAVGVDDIRIPTPSQPASAIKKTGSGQSIHSMHSSGFKPVTSTVSPPRVHTWSVSGDKVTPMRSPSRQQQPVDVVEPEFMTTIMGCDGDVMAQGTPPSSSVDCNPTASLQATPIVFPVPPEPDVSVPTPMEPAPKVSFVDKAVDRDPSLSRIDSDAFISGLKPVGPEVLKPAKHSKRKHKHRRSGSVEELNGEGVAKHKSSKHKEKQAGQAAPREPSVSSETLSVGSAGASTIAEVEAEIAQIRLLRREKLRRQMMEAEMMAAQQDAAMAASFISQRRNSMFPPPPPPPAFIPGVVRPLVPPNKRSSSSASSQSFDNMDLSQMKEMLPQSPSPTAKAGIIRATAAQRKANLSPKRSASPKRSMSPKQSVSPTIPPWKSSTGPYRRSVSPKPQYGSPLPYPGPSFWGIPQPHPMHPMHPQRYAAPGFHPWVIPQGLRQPYPMMQPHPSTSAASRRNAWFM